MFVRTVLPARQVTDMNWHDLIANSTVNSIIRPFWNGASAYIFVVVVVVVVVGGGGSEQASQTDSLGVGRVR